MKTLRPFVISLILALLPLAIASAQQETEIVPSKDNTLYETANGSTSNGAGAALYFGLTNQGSIRRALLAFDVAGNVPAGATIQSATLQITVQKTIAGSKTVSAHRVAQDWGEGTSRGTGSGGSAKENDATWIHTFFNTQKWQTPGGDYDAATLTSASAGNGGVVLPSTASFVSLVQNWLDAPDENFGLILIGDENSSPSAKAIASRESTAGGVPTLRVTYTVATSTERAGLPDFLTELVTYPNPSTTSATIQYGLSETRAVRIDLVDVMGRSVATPFRGVMTAGNHSTRIDTGSLTPGLYVVRLISDGGTASRPVIVR